MQRIEALEKKELKIAARQLQLLTQETITPTALRTTECTCYQHTEQYEMDKISAKRMMQPVEESYFEDEDEWDTAYTIPELQARISNASCHKRKRGLI